MPKLSARSLVKSLLIIALSFTPALVFAQLSPGNQPTLAQDAPAAPNPQTSQPAPFNNDSPPRPGSDSPMHIGGDVLPPKLLHSVGPKYSDEARAEKFSGSVQVYLWVDRNGNPTHVRVVRGAGHGLDEKAVEAIRQYKFQPATLNGEPVICDLYIDVNFQIRTKQ